jgi:hypothetical protein
MSLFLVKHRTAAPGTQDNQGFETPGGTTGRECQNGILDAARPEARAKERRRAYLEQLADIAGAEHPVHAGKLVRLRGREVGREDTHRRAPPPQLLARRARRRRARPSSGSCPCHLVPHRQEP